MNILISGGSGFLGRYVYKKLSTQNDTLIFISREDKNKNILRGKAKVYFEKADITDINALKSLKSRLFKNVGKMDRLIHLAASVPKNQKEDTILTFKVNVEGTANILDVFGEELDNIVYASTAEVYGLPKGNKSIDELYPTNPRSFYSAGKLSGEIVCKTYFEKEGLPIAILRFTTLYGPGDFINRAMPNFIKTALGGKDIKIYGGENIRDYLHVEDAADALCKASKLNENGIFNIGSGKGIKIRRVAELIRDKINPQLSIIKDQTNKAGVSSIILDTRKAAKIFDFHPRNLFPAGIEEEIEWTRKNLI